ncbi:MAG: hypothetical protein HY579_06265 [Nitrospinae bacterium]|nr:hypothetical protein [Nitrospinota bacterium]
MRQRLTLILLGTASLLLYLGMTALSRQFNWGQGYADRPILSYLALYFALFGLYAGAVAWVVRNPRDRPSFWVILLLGLLFRAVILPSQQIQEDDVYRYLWDGKVFANGINPYEYAPKQATDFKPLKIREPEKFLQTYGDRNVRDLERLNELKWENDTALRFFERINHPAVPTIYPPLAQFVFRAVALVRPDSVTAMRLAFLVFDLAAVTFIVLTLKTLGKDPGLCLVYFWSPLIVKETFNSTHLDILGIACLCGSVYFLVRKSFLPALLLLALSVLGKLYPLVLLPLYLKEMPTEKSRTAYPILGAAVFLGTVAALYAPFLDIGRKAFEGLRAYTVHWENNDSLFALLVYFFGDVLGLKSLEGFPLSTNLATFLSKAAVAAVLLGTLIYLLSSGRAGKERPDPFPTRTLKNLFVMMALAFLLSPVQNPWYLGWSVPFLCFFPHRSWILLTGLTGLYYLDFYFDYQEIRPYSLWIPWFEYAPFYLLLALENRARLKELFARKGRPSATGEGPANS